MTTVIYVLPDGTERSVQAKAGSSVMETAIHANIPGIDAECGGCCNCATCHVYVDEQTLQSMVPPDEIESDTLAGVAAPRQANSRLSCQIRIMADQLTIRVQIPTCQV